MGLVGLQSIVYGVEDLALGRRFFSEWGLTPDSGDPDSFRTREGTSIVLRRHDDPALPAAVEPGSTAREIVWGAESAQDLDALARRLAAHAEVRRDADGTIRFHDPAGFGVAIAMARRETLAPVDIPVNTPESKIRVDKIGTFYKQAAPRRIGHVVVMSPDIEVAERFYTEALGFYVSDRYIDRAVFLRSRGVAEHHELFVLKSHDDSAHFHHLAFEVHDIHEVFGGGLAFSKHGWQTHIGPGRHNISSCYFWYFKNPCGGAVEYYADCDLLTPAWEPRAIPQTPEWFAEWALATGVEQYGGVQTQLK